MASERGEWDEMRGSRVLKASAPAGGPPRQHGMETLNRDEPVG